MSHENGVKQILVVDGEHEMLTLYDVVLKGLGYNILKASNGPQALKLLESTTPHLIITGIMLPGMSGIELCQKIRLSARTSQIPIIAVSTQVQGDTVNASLKSGANTFLKKPFLPKELVAVVQHYMTEATQTQRANVARELPLVVL